MEKFGNITLYNDDCMNVMKTFNDNQFDLAIVDPPYGIGQNWRKDKNAKFHKHRNNFNNSIPDQNYFNELFRVSRFQIIWGANYYFNYLSPSNNLVFWDKGKDAKTQLGSAGELAWTNIKKYPLIKIDLTWNGCCVCENVERIHPHQKPIKLYKWLLQNYAIDGYKILDTHFGSLSIGIACHDMGFELTAIELDKIYYEAGKKRLKEHLRQLKLF